MNAGLFFNPQGRITKAQFQTGALALIALGFVLAVLPLLAAGTAMVAITTLTTLIGLVAMWCWIALWVKRLHQAGQTGWMTVLIVLGWVVLSNIVGTVVTMMFAPDLMTMSPEGGDVMEVIQQSMQATREVAIPSAIANAAVSLIYVFVLNAVLPSQDGENRYGPPPAA